MGSADDNDLPCLDDNDALRLVLDPTGKHAPAARAHVVHCQACHRLIATVAQMFVADDSQRQTPTRHDLLTTGVRFGAYRIEEEIGRGGMGTVYLATDDRLDRNVALKVLSLGVSDEAAIRALRTEGQSMARLHHPNVVEVLDVGHSEYGPFIAMEYVDGPDLRTWLRSAQHPTEQILDRMLEAGQGLAAAHACGIIHRDFKPANVLIGSDGRVRVADFGLAKLPHAALRTTSQLAQWPSGSSERTASSSHGLIGTPAYMAPEQIRGDPVGPAADQFAFCVALFEAFAGVRPFPMRSLAERLEAISVGSLEAPKRSIPKALLRPILVGLREDPRQRHADMDTLLRALRPRTSRIRVGLISATLMLTAVAAAFAAPTHPDHPCSTRSHPSTWPASAGIRVDEAWSSRGISPFTTRRLRRRLDEHAERWSATRAQLCTPEAEDTGLLRDKLVCLDAIGEEFDLFVDTAMSAGHDDAERFVRAAFDLRLPSRCAASSTTSVEERELVAKAGTLHTQYLIAHATGAEQDLQQLRYQVQNALERAERAGLFGLQGELTYLLATFAHLRHDVDEAARSFEHAYFLAKNAGDDAVSFDSAMAVATVAWETGDLERSWQWTRHVRALDPLHLDAARFAQLLVHEGDLHMHASAFAEAAAAYRSAQERLPPGGPARLRVGLLTSMAELHGRQAQHAEARDAYLRSIAYAEEHLGPQHPELMRPLIGLGISELSAGALPEARRSFERALAIATQTDDQLGRAMVHGNLALVHRALDQPTAALRSIRMADEILQRLFGEERIERAMSMANLAEAYYAVGLADEARGAATKARTMLTGGPTPPPALVYACELIEAQVDLDHGHPAMVARFERLVDDAPTRDYRVLADIGLLQALVADQAYDRALALAKSIYADEAQAPTGHTSRFAEGRLFYARALRARGDEGARDEQLALGRESLALVLDDPRGVRVRLESSRSSTALSP